MERKGIVEKGALLKEGGILEDAGLLRKSELTEEQKKKATNFSLEEHLRPAKEKLTEEANARKKAIAAGKLAKEKEKDSESSPALSPDSAQAAGASSKKANENRMRVVKEVMAKLKKTKEMEDMAKGGKKTVKSGGENGSKQPSEKTKRGDDGTKKPEDVKYVVAKDAKPKKAMDVAIPKKVTQVTKPKKIVVDSASGKLSKQSAAEMEEYFRERRQQAMESAAEEEKRDRRKKSGKASSTNGPKYRLLLAKFGEARKGVGLQQSASQISRDVYKDGGFSPLGPPTETETIDDSTENVSTFRHLLYSSEEVTERPGPDGAGPPAVRYKIVLHCLSRGTKENKTLELWEVPKTGFVIKVRACDGSHLVRKYVMRCVIHSFPFLSLGSNSEAISDTDIISA